MVCVLFRFVFWVLIYLCSLGWFLMSLGFDFSGLWVGFNFSVLWLISHGFGLVWISHGSGYWFLYSLSLGFEFLFSLCCCALDPNYLTVSTHLSDDPSHQVRPKSWSLLSPFFVHPIWWSSTGQPKTQSNPTRGQP